MFKKIAIIGVGLIGGSLGMAIKKRHLAFKVIGIGRRKSSIQKAIAKKAIDSGTLNMAKGLKDADLIIIATPVNKVKDKIRESLNYAKSGAVIMDVNSTKSDIVSYAERVLLRRAFFIGAHPIAGSESSGVTHAHNNLFENTICVLTPTAKTDKSALESIKKLWKALGASLSILSPADHDKLVSEISHLPHLLSYCLVNTISANAFGIAGSGFKDTTRIAKSDAGMWADIFINNGRPLLRSIRNFEEELNRLKKYISRKQKKPLLRKLSAAKTKREKIG